MNKSTINYNDPFWGNIAYQISGCLGKHPYPKKSIAQQVGNRTNKRNNTRLNPYKCPHCNHWHLGNNTSTL